MKLVYILYDSINNSIFAGQVWNLLLKKIQQMPALKITLISFERKILKHTYNHPNIKITQIKRNKYLGKITLFLDFLKLKKHLSQTPQQIIARGPFASWLALKLRNQFKNTSLTLQARGLSAEEYAYTHQTKNIIRKLLVKLRSFQLFSLEKQVYGSSIDSDITIECVSEALKDHLTKTYQANPLILSIAQQDLPLPIAASQLAKWRTILRNQLQIPQTTPIYCYSGSSHPWQCPKQTIQFFANVLKQDAHAFLLILTPQIIFFKKIIQESKLPKTNYLILNVDHQEIYKYLAMADFGLILREKHLLNWVSRPTKALEYQSAGLKIIHNHTVKWLEEKF